MTRVHIHSPNSGERASTRRCRASVASGGRFINNHQCLNKPAVYRMQDGQQYGFCKTHDPLEVKRREQESELRWREKQNRVIRPYLMMEKYRRALEKISTGVKNPKELARKALR